MSSVSIAWIAIVVTFLLPTIESSQGEVEDNREKWGDFWEKLNAIIRNIFSRPL
jgi:hypothetical protein